MANQWGRDSQGRTASGSGVAGTLVAAVVCFLLGAGGGYGYFTLTRADLKQEVDLLSGQLVETTAERDKLATDIAAYRKNAGSWAENLETELAELKLNEVPKLTRLLDKRDGELSALRKKLSETEKAAASAKEEASGLRTELEQVKTEEIPAIRENVAKALDLLKAEADAAQAALKTDLDKARAQSASLEERLRAALDSGDGTAAAAEDLQRQIKAGDDRAAALQKTIDALKAEIAALKAASLASRSGNATEQPAIETQPEPETTAARATRDQASVRRALDASVGLQALADADRQTLEDKLVAGDCVVPSLDLVFDRVPVLVLRNLMRDLKSDC